MEVVELFAGIGGFRLGFERAGFRVIYANEWDNYAADTYDKNFHQLRDPNQSVQKSASTNRGAEGQIKQLPKLSMEGLHGYGNDRIDRRDITAIDASDIPAHDVLVGGFPCQAFSIAGKRHGFKETRGTLFFDVARILANKRPRHLVLETVKGLLSHDGGKTFQTILGVLADLGYRVEWQILNSKDFGVPQNRERIYIVGHLRDECGRQVFPIAESNNNTNESREQSTDRLVSNAIDSSYYKGADGKRQLIAEPKIRRLTPKECERLQGFPDDWTAGESDTQRYKMCGNAVTVNVVEAVATRLAEICYNPNNLTAQ